MKRWDSEQLITTTKGRAYLLYQQEGRLPTYEEWLKMREISKKIFDKMDGLLFVREVNNMSDLISRQAAIDEEDSK